MLVKGAPGVVSGQGNQLVNVNDFRLCGAQPFFKLMTYYQSNPKQQASVKFE